MISTQPTDDSSDAAVSQVLDGGFGLRITPGKIAGIYVVFGFGALIFSDLVLTQYLSGSLLRQVQALKGGVEVVLTAGLIFVLTAYSHTQLKSAADRIETARDELAVLHRVMRHNLRNDINLIQGKAQLAKVDGSGDAVPHCESIIDATEDIMHYSEHARHIRKVTETSPERRVIDLSALLNRVVTFHPLLDEDVDVETNIPEGVTVRANPLLEAAITELVTNAVTHSDEATPWVRIEVVADAGEMVELRISDNGPGFPVAEREALENGLESQIRHSTGIGLWFVDWTAEHSGGNVTVIDPEAGGSIVVLSLPPGDMT